MIKVRNENTPSIWLKDEVLGALNDIPFKVVGEVVFTNPNSYPYWKNGDEITGWHETNSKTIYIDYRLTEDDFSPDCGSICSSSVMGLVAHEVGHMMMTSVENRQFEGKKIRSIIGQYYNNDTEAPSDYSLENRDEYFAEVFALSIVHPESLTEKQKEMVDLVIWTHEKR